MDSDTISAVANCVMAFGTVTSLGFVGYQIRAARKEFFSQNERTSMEKAVDLARYYQEELLSRQIIIQHVFEDVGLNSMVDDLDLMGMCEFDPEELSELSKGKKNFIEEYTELSKSDKIATAYRNYLAIDQSQGELNLKVDITNHTEEDKEIANEMALKIVNSKMNEKYLHNFWCMAFDFLNKLEFFSMNFKSKLADEEVLYQSLHQTYIAAVKILYVEIARMNAQPEDKYYTNIITLFNNWKDKYMRYVEVVKKNKYDAKKSGIHSGKEYRCQ